MTRILVVEDEESYRDPLTYQLTREGFEVVEAADGNAALAAYDAEGADLVLLDLMLPGRDGYEVCQTLRADGFRRKIVMLTAKGREAEITKGFAVGADDHVTKPFGTQELVARVQQLLGAGP